MAVATPGGSTTGPVAVVMTGPVAAVVWTTDLISLYRSRYADMVRVAFLLTGSMAEAEEIVQDAFVKIRNRIDRVDNPTAYLRTTADQSDTATEAWYNSRRLWMVDIADLTSAHAVSGASVGAALPSWSSDGRTLRYTARQAVESIPPFGGQPERLSGPTPLVGTPALSGPTAYGKTGWTGHAVWAP